MIQAKNSDGKVTKDEAVKQLKANFDRVDADRDGEITADELAALAKRMNGRQRSQNADNAPRAQPVVPDDVIFQTDIAYRDGNMTEEAPMVRI